VTDTSVAADLNQTLDVKVNLTFKVTLNGKVPVYYGSDLADIILGEVLDAGVGVNPCRL
jgi:hypothetical protein